MMADSVIRRTGQQWKFLLAVTFLLLGSFLPLAKGLGMTWTVGTIVAVLGYGFALAFIRCPSCKGHWFWKAALYAEMYAPLFKTSQCPICKHNFD